MVNSIFRKEFGGYCAIIDHRLKTDKTRYLFDYSNQFNVKKGDETYLDIGMESLSFVLDMIKHNSAVSDIDGILSLIVSEFKYDTLEFMKLLLIRMRKTDSSNLRERCDEDFRLLTKDSIKKEIGTTIFLPSNCLFIVKNLDDFIRKIRVLIKKINSENSVNSGSQSIRGNLNSLSYRLSLIDTDIRNYLYDHYREQNI